jgi:hypothetical protein
MRTNSFPELVANPFLTKDSFGSPKHVGVQEASEALTRIAEAPIVRWVQFPAGVLFFTLVDGDPESGALYVFDRKLGTIYSLDFEDKKYGGYSLQDYETLVRQYRLLVLTRCPWRLRRCVRGRKGR